MWWDVLAAAGAVAVGALLLRTPRLQPARPPANAAACSVVVPARDEAANLPALLASLAAGDVRPGEVIVVDDESSDGTADVAAREGATVVRPGPLPPGWMGKPWACAAGADAARHDVLVFLDADVRLAPGGLAAVLAALEHVGGLVSVQPQHRPGRAVEQLSVVFNVCGVAGAGGGAPGRARVAFGPCLVVGRAEHDRLGGHAAVAASVIEDVDLARRARRLGVPVSTFRGGDLITFRMYPGGWRAMIDGWTKNIALGAGASPWWALLATVAWVTGLGAVAVRLATPSWPAVVAYALAALTCGWVFRRIGRFRWWTALCFPVPLAVFLGVFVRSLFAVATRRPVAWRGRRVVHDDRRLTTRR